MLTSGLAYIFRVGVAYCTIVNKTMSMQKSNECNTVAHLCFWTLISFLKTDRLLTEKQATLY